MPGAAITGFANLLEWLELLLLILEVLIVLLLDILPDLWDALTLNPVYPFEYGHQTLPGVTTVPIRFTDGGIRQLF